MQDARDRRRAPDDSQPSWELKVKVMELHNSHSVRELAHRVRRGQEGWVLDDGSVGDFPFGYESFFLDHDWEEQLRRRGPKPKKGIRIHDPEARQVREVFARFNEGCSINRIARELTEAGASKGRRATTPGWHPQQVRRMLGNEKYVGRWVWGTTETVRNSLGDKKQVKLPQHKWSVRDRPDLRIIEQDVWDRAQRSLTELENQFGVKDGQKKRGPKARPSDVYPRSLLGGVLVCARAGPFSTPKPAESGKGGGVFPHNSGIIPLGPVEVRGSVTIYQHRQGPRSGGPRELHEHGHDDSLRPVPPGGEQGR